jgi:hypothetical protein
MTCAATIQNDAIWLESRDFEVMPLNARLMPRVQELREALRQGAAAYPDHSRENFYDVELKSGWSYIHVRDDARTVYLVAFSRS